MGGWLTCDPPFAHIVGPISIGRRSHAKPSAILARITSHFLISGEPQTTFHGSCIPHGRAASCLPWPTALDGLHRQRTVRRRGGAHPRYKLYV